MKTKLLISILLSVLFFKAFAQDTCECKNLKINVTTENLFNEIRIVKTRNQLDSFILNPIEITINFKYISKYYTYDWAFPNSFGKYYFNNNRSKKFNTDSLIILSFISDLKNPLVVIKPAHKNIMYNVANIEEGNINKYFLLYKKHDVPGSLLLKEYNVGIDSFGCVGCENIYTYKYIYDRNDLAKNLLNDSLQLYYFQIPNEFLTKLGAKKCYTKSNLFALPPHIKDTLVYIDRLDTFIDRGFYSNYPYQNSLMEDVCYKFQTQKPGIYPYFGFIVYKNYAEQLYKKYRIRTKLKHFFNKEHDNRVAKFAIIKSKKFKLTAKYVFGDTLMINRIEYYPSGKEYLFSGIYHNDDCRFFASRFYAWNSKEFLSKLIYIKEMKNDCKSFERVQLNYGSSWHINLEFKKRSNKIKKIVLIR